MKIKLKKLGKIITGNTPKKSDKQNYTFNDICFVKPSDISDDVITKITNTEHYISNYATNTARLAPKDSVLVTCIGIIGKVAILEKNSAFNQQINAIIPYKDKVLSNYLAYNLFYRKNYMQQKANAPVVPIINKTQFEDLEITFHSLEEQKKIANTLDKVTNLIELKKKQLEKLDIFSKALFVEMFGDPVENPKNWRKENLNKFIMYANNGLSRRGKDITGNIVLRLTELKNGYIDYSKVNRMCIKENEEKYLLKDNDVLFARVNGNPINVGRSAVFHIKSEKVYFNDHIIRIHFKEEYINNFFISFLFNTNYGRVCVSKNIKTSAGQYTISQDGISSLTFPIPPIELQNQFAKKVEQIDKIKLSIQDSLNKLETLKKSLMQEYFS